jgi:carboxyl-terminal processing protease
LTLYLEQPPAQIPHLGYTGLGEDRCKTLNGEFRNLQFCFLVFCWLLTAHRLFSQSDKPSDEVTTESLKFTEVYEAVEKNFMDRVEPDQAIFDGGIRGMLAKLDPFSAFFDRDQFEMLQQQARGEALGFGSILYVTPGKVLVLQAAQGSPSWRAGLGPGDEIVEINGERVSRLDFQSLIALLQRSRSHPVRLGVIHPGKLIAQDFELKPAEVALPTVDKDFALSTGIIYLHLTGFEQKTPREVVAALERLDASHAKGLLFDLRDNHGGMVDAAVGVANLFLKPGSLVLTTQGRSMPEKRYQTSSVPQQFDLPLVVLVNGNTASAAEVLTAALQEHDRAVIAGEPTYGKGVVESVVALEEKTGLALTTGQYFTPSGRSIQRPLPGTAFAPTEENTDPTPNPGNFHTDAGRPITAGGGITPDVTIPPRPIDPWLAFLNQRGAFTGFAEEYLTLHGKVDESFKPSEAVLENFKEYLVKNRTRVPEEFWVQDQDYLKVRIKTELFNLVFGLARGDEIETNNDPQVQKSTTLFTRIPRILRTGKAK